MTFSQIHTGKDSYKYDSFFPLAIVQWNALPENVAAFNVILFSFLDSSNPYFLWWIHPWNLILWLTPLQGFH